MKQLRISSCMNLHAPWREDPTVYAREGLLFLKKIGFDAADFPMSLLQRFACDWTPMVEQIQRHAEEIGLRFELCHLPFGFKNNGSAEEQETFCRQVLRSIDAAKHFGVKFAVLHPNSVTVPEAEFDARKEYDAVMKHLAPFVEYANRQGVSVVIENMRLVHQNYPVHRYCGDPEELCTIADALGIGVCWDFGHAHINGLQQRESLRYVGSRLKMLHVNDNFAGDDVHIPPFCGKIDWIDAMQGLTDVGYDGLFNYEINTGRIPEQPREAFATYLLSAAKELCSHID